MLNDVGPIMSAIRNIFIIFDVCIYYFVNFGFIMLFNIATFNIVDRKMIFDIFSRIQLIIGIFMLFQLAMTIIKGIVNPDSFTDSKNGAGNVIMRIIVSLVLLALLVPLNISNPKNEYEKQINNNGILFGTLYSLQYRILTNDTLGKLILGDDSTNYTSSDPDSKSLDEFGNKFTTTVIKAFYTLNVDDEGNYVCNDGWDEVYKSDQITAHEIIINGTRTCGDDNWPSWAKTLYDLTPYGAIDGAIHDEKYSISMSYITCTIVGIVLLVLLCMMIFNVAIRVFKLVALQLLAPIPVISYMDPKGSKDNAFSSWLKLLGATYLELFIQLGVIYFAISIIKSFMKRFPELSLQTVVDTTSTGAVQGLVLLRWTFIIMTIALFIFAKDAPKFFKQMLGVKDDGKGFFGAFGTAMGFGATAIGAVGSFNAGRAASRMADIQNHDEAYANRFGNRAKHIAAGIVGAGKGLAAGSAAASESKGNGIAKTMAAWKAMDQVSDSAMQNGVTGSTFIGRTFARGSKIVQGAGNTDFDRETRAISQKKDIEKSAKDLSTYLKGKGKTDGANYAVTTDSIIIDDKGTKHKFSGTVNEFSRIRAQALADQQARRGNGSFTFGGLQLNANDQGLMEKIEDELCLSAGDEWALRQEYGQRNAKRIVELKLLHPGFNDTQIKNQLELEVRTDITTQNPTWSQAQIDAETIRRTVASNIDSGYAQKRDTYNEDIKGADDPNNVKLYNEYTFDEANGTMTNTSTMVNKASRAAGGEAVRRESNAIYKKQRADFGAIKKNGG